jgi:anaerobic ribonucleoside-triphosphate reductase activating protein
MRKMDISNGEGVGVSLFVQGCPFHCSNCFNQETWNYDKGKEWNDTTKNTFLNFVKKPYITRVSLLGGEPLYDKNLDGISDLCKIIKSQYPDKKIWLYSGYTFDSIFNSRHYDMLRRQYIISQCDIMVDGRFVESLKDMNLKFRGSSNQRIIDVQKSLQQNKVILYKEKELN